MELSYLFSPRVNTVPSSGVTSQDHQVQDSRVSEVNMHRRLRGSKMGFVLSKKSADSLGVPLRQCIKSKTTC
jgi:hypothetical protein